MLLTRPASSEDLKYFREITAERELTPNVKMP